MSGIEQCDSDWCYALLTHCCIDVVNEIVPEIGEPENDDPAHRYGQWCCVVGSNLPPSTMGQVFMEVLRAQKRDGNAQQRHSLIPAAIHMLAQQAVTE